MCGGFNTGLNYSCLPSASLEFESPPIRLGVFVEGFWGIFRRSLQPNLGGEIAPRIGFVGNKVKFHKRTDDATRPTSLLSPFGGDEILISMVALWMFGPYDLNRIAERERNSVLRGLGVNLPPYVILETKCALVSILSYLALNAISGIFREFTAHTRRIDGSFPTCFTVRLNVTFEMRRLRSYD